MSLPLRIVLLVGCGLVASLEAPEAGAWLSAGISGPYAERSEPAASAPSAQRFDVLPFGPVLFTLAPLGVSANATLAVGR